MNELSKLTDDELHISAIESARREREETINVLKHLNEIERRRLYAKYDCDSLYAYCVKKLSMSDGMAGRYVGASRLMFEVPKLEDKVLEGSMSFTSVTQASVFFNKEARAGNAFDKSEKLELIESLDQKSTREVEKILLSQASSTELHFQESVKHKTLDHVEVKILIDQETLDLLEKLKEIWSHAMPYASLADIVKRSAEIAVEKCDPQRKAERAVVRAEKKIAASSQSNNQTSTPAPEREQKSQDPNRLDADLVPRVSWMEVRSHHQSLGAEKAKACEVTGTKTGIALPRTRYIHSAVRHTVYLKEGHRCTHRDPKTNQLCGSKTFLELDHIIPFAMGGTSEPENLRLRCRAHNRQHAMMSGLKLRH